MTIIRTFAYRRRVHTCIAGVLFKFEPWRQILSRQWIQQLFQHGGCLSSDRLPPPPLLVVVISRRGGEHKHPSVFRAAAAKGGRVAVRARLARFAFILCSKTSCNASRHLFSTFCIGFFFLPANVRSRDLEIATYVGDRFRTMTLRVSRSKLAYGKDRLNAARGVWQGHVDKVYDN